jgi:hypothetical protein
VTTAVWAERAVPDPPLFVAVTTTRIVKPASLLDNEYEVLVAPLKSEHDAPVLSHRRH